MFSNGSTPGMDKAKRIHVSNIPFKMTDSDLVKEFKVSNSLTASQLLTSTSALCAQVFGTVTEAQIVSNERGSKGFGFVTFKQGSCADVAKREMNGRIIAGRVIEVSLPDTRQS